MCIFVFIFRLAIMVYLTAPCSPIHSTKMVFALLFIEMMVARDQSMTDNLLSDFRASTWSPCYKPSMNEIYSIVRSMSGENCNIYCTLFYSIHVEYGLIFAPIIEPLRIQDESQGLICLNLIWLVFEDLQARSHGILQNHVSILSWY